MQGQLGNYDRDTALVDHARDLHGAGCDQVRELGYHDRRQLHNLKYFTWVEQQGKTADELRQLWDPDFWTTTFAVADQWDLMIRAFNDRVGMVSG